jgi:hypothetical protein
VSAKPVANRETGLCEHCGQSIDRHVRLDTDYGPAFFCDEAAAQKYLDDMMMIGGPSPREESHEDCGPVAVDYLAAADAASECVLGVPMVRTDDEKMADEALSIALLAGWHVDSGKQINLTHNSADELKARAALARIIREKMNGFSGELLALAIDPQTESTWPDMRPARKIKFEKPGRPSTLMRDKLVVDYIRRLRFNNTEPNDMKFYLMQAAEKFGGLSYSSVHAIWNAHEKLIEEARSKK